MFRTVITIVFALVLAADFIVTAVSKKSRLTDVIIRALMVLAFGYIAQAV